MENTSAILNYNSQTAAVQNIFNNLDGYFKSPTAGQITADAKNPNVFSVVNECGASVYAAAEGLVIENGYSKKYGNYVKIKHPNGNQTIYGHNDKNLVSANQYVYQGDLVAYVGVVKKSKKTSECYLYFEIIK